jgi:predicted CopG family antitoxin
MNGRVRLTISLRRDEFDRLLRMKSEEGSGSLSGWIKKKLKVS